MAQANDPSPMLLLTRPEAQSRAFLAEVEAAAGRKVAAVISPLIEIEPVGLIPDLEPFDGIIVTSAHAVRRLGASLSGRDVLAVGEATAALARDFGARSICLGRDVSVFVDQWNGRAGRYLYARGRHVRADLIAALGSGVQDIVVYDQVSKPLESDALDLLAGEEPVLAPLFSARTAELLAASGPFLAPLTVLAISDAVAATWPFEGDVRVSQTPDAKGVCDLIVQEL